MNKRGLSTTVTSLVIILIALIAITMVWVVIKNILNKGAEEINLDGFDMDSESSNSQINNIESEINTNPEGSNSDDSNLEGSNNDLDVSGSGITREISKTSVNQNEEIQVRLIVSIKDGERFYSIEEKFPSQSQVVNNGGGKLNNLNTTLHWLVIQNAQDIVYTYTIKAPSNQGIYEFDGNYMLEGYTDPKKISGQNTITVD